MSDDVLKAADKLTPRAVPLSTLAQVLTRLGTEKVTEAMLRADVEAGAPTNADGTVNVVHYIAWLVQEQSRGD
jgi:hypothetical protein